MQTPVPVIEVPDYADTIGTWRPDGEGNTRHAIHFPDVRAQLVVESFVSTFSEQVLVETSKSGKKSIRIAQGDNVAIRVGNPELILERVLPVCQQQLKQSGRMYFGEFSRRFIAGEYFHLLSVRSERPDYHTVVDWMRTKQGVGILMDQRQQMLDLRN